MRDDHVSPMDGCEGRDAGRRGVGKDGKCRFQPGQLSSDVGSDVRLDGWWDVVGVDGTARYRSTYTQ